MQIELTLPCYYALRVLNDYTWRSAFADMQILKKYGIDTEISDFDEFVSFYATVNSNCYEDLHDEYYRNVAYAPKYSHDELLQTLVKSALDVKVSTVDDYTKDRMERAKNDCLEMLDKVKGLLASYYIDEAINDLVSQENAGVWRTGTHESLDSEYYRYLNGYQTLEESSQNSYSDKRMRSLFDHE